MRTPDYSRNGVQGVQVGHHLGQRFSRESRKRWTPSLFRAFLTVFRFKKMVSKKKSTLDTLDFFLGSNQHFPTVHFRMVSKFSPFTKGGHHFPTVNMLGGCDV